MFFLLSACENPDILRIILLFKKILNIVTTLLPIMLIIFLVIDLVKMVITGDDKQQGKTMKTIVNRIIFAILIFFIPTIVNVIMTLVSNTGIKVGTDYTTCFENANKQKIEEMQKEQDKEDKEFEEQIKQDSANNNNNNNNNNGNNNSSNNNSSTTKPNNTQPNDSSQIATEMIRIAEAQRGTKEEPDGSNYTKFHEEFKVAKDTPWCGLFVTWVAKKTQLSNGSNLFDSIINSKNHPQANWYSVDMTIQFFNTDQQLDYYKSKSKGGSYTPKKGDYIFFNQHVGIVSNVRDGYVTTIEGNSENKVTGYNYKLDSTKIIGYGSWY